MDENVNDTPSMGFKTIESDEYKSIYYINIILIILITLIIIASIFCSIIFGFEWKNYKESFSQYLSWITLGILGVLLGLVLYSYIDLSKVKKTIQEQDEILTDLTVVASQKTTREDLRQKIAKLVHSKLTNKNDINVNEFANYLYGRSDVLYTKGDENGRNKKIIASNRGIEPVSIDEYEKQKKIANRTGWESGFATGREQGRFEQARSEQARQDQTRDEAMEQARRMGMAQGRQEIITRINNANSNNYGLLDPEVVD